MFFNVLLCHYGIQSGINVVRRQSHIQALTRPRSDLLQQNGDLMCLQTSMNNYGIFHDDFLQSHFHCWNKKWKNVMSGKSTIHFGNLFRFFPAQYAFGCFLRYWDQILVPEIKEVFNYLIEKTTSICLLSRTNKIVIKYLSSFVHIFWNQWFICLDSTKN